MDKERTKPDQKLCDMVKMMLAGNGAKVSQVVELLGISTATVNRIRKAGYSLEQFEKDKKDRNERKKELKAQKVGSYGCVYTGTCELPRPGIELTPEGPINRETIEAVRDELTKEIPGQICMDLQPAEEKEEEVVTYLAAIYNQHTQIIVNQGKIIEKLDAIFIGMEGMHRYRAGKTDLLIKTLGYMMEKMDRMNDTMSQILRRTDK